MKNRLTFALVAIIATASPTMAFADHIDSQCSITQCHVGQKVWIEGGNRNDAYFACKSSQLSDYANGLLGIIGTQAMFGVRPQISRATGEPVYVGETEALIVHWRQRAGVQNFYQANSQCKKIATHGRKVPATIISIPSLQRQDTLDDGAAEVKVGNQEYWLPYAYLNSKR